MREIDKPFRFRWDFCVVWLLLLIPVAYLLPQWRGQPTYAHYLLVFFVALFAAFLLYGPVLLARQVFASGSRGWLVARVFTTIILVAVVVLGAIYAFGLYTETRGHLFALLFTVAAIVYLHWRLD
jgi:hypothetical protein